MTTFINWLLPFLTLLANIGIVLFFLIIILTRVSRPVQKIYTNTLVPLLQKFGLPLAFFVALGATAGSLFYSEIMHYAPCDLCWYQRLFIYPQIFLAGLALWKNEKKINDYLLLLSVVGTLIATYHFFLQLNPSAFAPCSTSAFAVSCATKYVESYGYITFPVMSLTAFILIMIAAYFSREKK